MNERPCKCGYIQQKLLFTWVCDACDGKFPKPISFKHFKPQETTTKYLDPYPIGYSNKELEKWLKQRPNLKIEVTYSLDFSGKISEIYYDDKIERFILNNKLPLRELYEFTCVGPK